MSSWTIDPVANPWILAAVVAGLLVLLRLGPAYIRLSRSRKTTLLALRAAVIGLAATALLRPGCVTTIQKQQTAVLMLFVDSTRSMTLPHRTTGSSRWEAVQAMLNESATALGALADTNIDVQVFGFDTRATVVPVHDGQIRLPDEPQGGETDMGTSLHQGLRAARDQRLLAVVLAGDGVQNAVDPDVELNQAVRGIENQQAPLYTIPFGQSEEAGQFADIAIENMPDQYSVWVKNNLNVTATLSARGFANQELPVQLILVDPAGRERVVDTRRVLIQTENERQTVQLACVPEQAGQFRLIVRAEPQPREAATRNNELPAFVTINEGGLRVLFLYSGLGWEQKFLRQALAAYQDIQLDVLPIDVRNRDQWPLNLERAFADPRYDVFILGNVDSRALFQKDFQEANLRALSSAVTSGKGLMMLGGFHSFGPGLYHSTPLADLLPVRMDFVEKQDFDAPVRRDLHIQRPLRLQPSGSHYITRIAPDGDEQIWNQLPELDGANRFLDVKDNSEILLSSQSDEPILVAAHVGGRVLAFAGDSTWKWWTHGFAEAHKRFWRQAVLWLAFRDGMSQDNIWIDLPQRRFEPHGTVQFSAGADTSAAEGPQSVRLTAQLQRPDGQRQEISIARGERQHVGQIDRQFLADPGVYTIEVNGMLAGNSLGTAKAEFVVFDRDKEKSIAGADPDRLGRMAAQTARWGGRLIEAEDFAGLLGEIAQQSPQMEIQVPFKWRLGDTWQDSLFFLLAFTALIATEWTLRKKWGLV